MFKKIFIAIALLCCSFSEAKYEVEEYQLDNGLRVIFIKKSPSTVMYFSVWYKGGSLRDFSGKSGVAHFLEHMAFETNDREFSNYLERIGAESNAFTQYNSICFYEIFEKSYLEDIVKREAERMQYIKIDDTSFQAEKGAILQERNRYVDNSPWGMLMEEGHANIFNRKSGGIGIIGWKHEIESITKEDLYAYHNKWFAPNNATIIAVGDIDFSRLKKTIDKYFNDIPAKELPTISTKKRIPTERHSVRLYSQKIGNVSMRIIYPVSDLSFKKRIALTLAIDTLQSPSSAVTKELAIIDKDQSLAFSYCDEGYSYDFVQILLSESIHNREYLLTLWKYFRSKILNGGISQKELDLVKKRYKSALLCAQDEISFFGQFIGGLLMADYKIEDILSFAEVIQSITLKECQDVLKMVLSRKPSAILEMIARGLDRE